MSSTLESLLVATECPTREAAWADLVAVHSRLLLHVARDLFREHDGAMDAYAFVLERLQEDDYRRLRGFKNDGRSRFTTWLTVVARRLCLDYYRQRYGRPRGDPATNGSAERSAARRRLMDLTAVDPELAAHLAIADRTHEPDADVRHQQLRDAVSAALSELPADDRLLLKLRFDDGLSGLEISRVLGLATPFHVFRRLNATFNRLRGSLRARGVESSAP